MKKTTLFLLTFLATFAFTACDDETDTIGSSIVPENDKITVDTLTLYAKSRSIMANDSIIANTNSVYLGRYTDAESNTVFESDFIAQFNCVENYGFPENGVIGDSTIGVELKLFYQDYFGDSLNTMKCEVYELENTLQEGITYYTNIDPTEFYNEESEPIASKTYCAVDYTIPDSIKNGSSYSKNISIKLPNSIGKHFIDKYYETNANGDSIGKIHFSNSEEFINNVFKGLYVKCVQGDGTIMNINMARINVSFNYYVKSKSGELDSIVRGISTFSSTKEVLQVNRFNNSNLEELANDNSCTYIKTPAGIFTEVELPIKEIIENTDTLNSVRIIFTKYNSTNSSQYKYATPTQLLMVRKCDMYSFFQRNKLYDNKTSFITSYNSTNNKYVYNNIAHLINYCADELRTNSESDADWENKNPDWNKVVLIPVSINSDSSTGSIVSLGHEHGLTSTRLVGGENHPIAIRIVSSKFRNE